MAGDPRPEVGLVAEFACGVPAEPLDGIGVAGDVDVAVRRGQTQWRGADEERIEG